MRKYGGAIEKVIRTGKRIRQILRLRYILSAFLVRNSSPPIALTSSSRRWQLTEKRQSSKRWWFPASVARRIPPKQSLQRTALSGRR
jgi:hypothetical protein